MHRTAQQIGVFVGLAIAGAMGWYYVGPYRWLAEAQLRVLGAYYPFLTWLVLALVIGLPIGAAFSAAAQRIGLRDDYDVLLDRYGWVLFTTGGRLLLIGAGLTITGGVLASRAIAAGTIQPVSVASLERAEPPPGSFVALIGGEAFPDEALVVDHRAYVPVVAESTMPAVFLSVAEDALDHPLPAQRGMLVANGLPNLARAGFEDVGIVPGNHYVLEVGGSPSTDRRAGGLIAMLGLALFGIGATMRMSGRS